MVLAMNCKITFPPTERHKETFVLKKVISVNIESSWKYLTDKATIELPRKSIPLFAENNRTNYYSHKEYIKQGDPIKIELGYNGNLEQEFVGYITQIMDGIPVIMKLEDEMYQLKKQAVNIALSNRCVRNRTGFCSFSKNYGCKSFRIFKR